MAEVLRILFHRRLWEEWADVTVHSWIAATGQPNTFYELSDPSLIHRSPHENDAPDEIQQPSMPSRSHQYALLARLSSLLHQSRLNTDEEAEPRSTTPSSSHLDPLIGRLSSLFRSQLQIMRKSNSHNAQAVHVLSKWLQCGTGMYVPSMHFTISVV
ncbi:hypothetical protein P692DRAFT_20870495 [Suillus brevipes Sb2]|nr:hypothetical protein P692DRAFT_20870495 [Suillus brevipes Sb2]